jgi:imidazolonepropionase-like amidohydrolase
MEVLAEATGYPAVEVLKLATSRSAELLELPDRGVIEPGRLADLLVVEGNPTEDLSTLNNVRYVIQGGEIVFAAQQFAIQRTRSKAPRQLSHPSP